MGYLFSESSYTKAYKNVSGLFKIDGSHYTFDASENFAHLNTVTNTIELSGPYKPTDSAPSTPKFLPFNTLNPDDPNALMESENYWFGMTVSADFMQPKDGEVTNSDGSTEPMEFSFTGDDDVWVFIDGALVLDLGGIHDAATGTINFATGEVDNGSGSKQSLYALMLAAKGQDWVAANMVSIGNDHYVFKDYSNHTFNFFYLERGAGGSNCKLDFNLQTVPSGVIQIGKEITDAPSSDFVDAKFTIQVNVAHTDDGTKPSGETDYKPYAGLLSGL